MNGRLTITEVAKYIGVTPRTIMRWEKMGKIKRSRRDWRGWRFYLKEDMEDIRKFYESSYEYEEGRSTIMNIAKGTLIAVLIFAAFLSLPILCGFAHAQQGAVKPGAITETSTTLNVDLSKLQTVGTPVVSSKYTLGPDDVIEIEVRRHPEFSGKYTINSEGKIEYKFIGDMAVDGMTKAQFQQKLIGMLSEYIIDPEVNVQIVQYLSKVYYVIGEVNRPGKFYMNGDSATVLNAIVAAGLPNQAASTRKCRLITPSAKGRSKIVYVNVYELLYGGNLKCNVAMKPGDILYIPSTIIAKVIQVIRPVTDTVSSAAGSAAAGTALAL